MDWEPPLWLAVAVACASYALFWHVVSDDTFIHLRYVNNLQEHGQLVYNQGEFVEGITNVGYVLAFLPVHFFGLTADKLLCWAGFLMLVVLGWHVNPQLGLLLSVDPVTVMFASHGMESVWAMLGLFLAFKGHLDGDRRVFAVGASFAVLMRSDLVWVALALAAMDRDWRKALWPLATLALVTAFRLLYYGSPVPLSYLERVFVGTNPSPSIVLLFAFASAAYLVPFLHGARNIPRGLLLLLGVFMLAYGPSSAVFGGRYVSYALPAAYLLYFASGNGLSRGALVWVLVMLLAVNAGSSLVAGRYMEGKRMAVEHGVDASAWAGLAYFTDGDFTDLSALHSPELLGYMVSNDREGIYSLMEGRTVLASTLGISSSIDLRPREVAEERCEAVETVRFGHAVETEVTVYRC